MKPRILRVLFPLAIGCGLAALFFLASTLPLAQVKAQASLLPVSLPALGESAMSHLASAPLAPSAAESTQYLPFIPNNYHPTVLCDTAPSLISPENGAAVDTLLPQLTYIQGSFPISYTQISIADNPGFSNSISYSSYGGGAPTQHTLSLFDNLAPGTKYYWHVQDFCGSQGSPLSPNYTFTTGSNGTILPAPVQVSPANATVNVSKYITITWNSVPGATGYKLFVHPVGSGGTIYFTVGTSRLILNQQANTTYEWTVQARNSYAFGNASPTWQYTTGSFSVQEEPQVDTIYERKGEQVTLLR